MATAVEIQAMLAELPTTQLSPRVHIYGLTDPRTGFIRYIGKSIRPAQRFLEHMKDRSTCHRCHWISELRELGLTPGFILIETVDGAAPWQEAERYWIARARREGWPITNCAAGGQGVDVLSPEASERRANAWKGRKHRPESLYRIGSAMRGKKHKPETKARVSAMQKGRKILWIDKVAAALRKLSEADQCTIVSRLAGGAKVIDLAREYGVHRTTISKVKKGTYLCQK